MAIHKHHIKSLRLLFSPFMGELERVFLMLLLLASCSEGEVSNKYSNLRARLTIDNVLQAPKALLPACESMGEYCTVTSDGERFLFTSATNKTDTINILASNSYNGYYLGLSGFIVGKLTIPEVGEDFVRVVCYDRACSNCYQNEHFTKPVVWKKGANDYVECKSCGRTYNLNDVGNISDGPGGRPLYRYRVNYYSQSHLLNIQN